MRRVTVLAAVTVALITVSAHAASSSKPQPPSPAAPAADAKGAGWKAGEVNAPPSATDPAYAAFDIGHYMEAKKLAEEAAAKGDAAANTMLGQLYEQGLGVPQDFNKAAEWYTKGAAAGDTDF